MKVKLELLKPNPFKKYINDGKLNKDRVEILKESIEHGTLPEFFVARKHNGFFEISFGHHRLQALKDVKGKDYVVDVNVVSFSDEQMLVDMVRENITHRDTDFQDTKQSILLARGWLTANVPTVQLFDSRFDSRNDKGQLLGSNPQPNSCRSIAKFLSKNGKTIGRQTVKNYLNIADKLNPEINVKKQTHATAEHKNKNDDSIGVRDAIKLASITDDWDEQNDLIKALKNSREQHGNDKQTNLTKYSNAPKKIKLKVREGKIDIADIEDASIKENVKEHNEKNPRLEFMPNFAGRLRQFDKDVQILEKQVRAFKMVFHSNEFKEKYYTLKPKQKKNLHSVINNIYTRISQCYEEVEFFKGLLSDKELLEEMK